MYLVCRLSSGLERRCTRCWIRKDELSLFRVSLIIYRLQMCAFSVLRPTIKIGRSPNLIWSGMAQRLCFKIGVRQSKCLLIVRRETYLLYTTARQQTANGGDTGPVCWRLCRAARTIISLRTTRLQRESMHSGSSLTRPLVRRKP